MNTPTQPMAELQALKSETAQLEGQVRAEFQALLAEFEASYPPLRILAQLRMPPDQLAKWLRAPEAD